MSGLVLRRSPRPFARALALVVACGTSVSALAQDDVRSSFGLEAPVMEAMAAAAFPGATIDWDAQSLVRPGAEPEPVEFVSYTEESQGDGLLAIAAIQFPEEIREVVAKALAGEAVESSATPPHLVVVRLSAERMIVDSHAATLDTNGVAAECQSLAVIPDVEDPALSSIEVELSSLHVGSKWVASMIWSGRVGAEDITLTRLIPLVFSRQNSDGAVATEILELEEVSATELVLRGQASGAIFTYTCDPNCIVPAALILGE